MTSESGVFVVDDDTSVLRAITRLLSFEFAVRPFDSPAWFLHALRPDTPGCILLDLALPGSSGLESEVFSHVIAGRLDTQIAARLGTAERTVKVRRAGACTNVRAVSPEP
jgi:FixJ family two-component response regulator